MQSSNTKMLETVSENLKNVAEMQAIKKLIKKSLPSKKISSTGDKTSALAKQVQLSPTQSRSSSDSSTDSDDTMMDVETDALENEGPPRKRLRTSDPNTSEDGEDAGGSSVMVARPAHAGKAIAEPLTYYGTKLRLFLLHPSEGKIEDSHFEARYPELWAQCLAQIEELSALSYWRSWVNPTTRSCMHSYVKLRVPAREVQWTDEHPHCRPCQHCVEQDRQCIILHEDGKEMVVLPKVAAAED
ncbi:hypothetical protein HDK77DRAFT_490205 [Phyllosticta capitalensis]